MANKAWPHSLIARERVAVQLISVRKNRWPRICVSRSQRRPHVFGDEKVSRRDKINAAMCALVYMVSRTSLYYLYCALTLNYAPAFFAFFTFAGCKLENCLIFLFILVRIYFAVFDILQDRAIIP